LSAIHILAFCVYARLVVAVPCDTFTTSGETGLTEIRDWFRMASWRGRCRAGVSFRRSTVELPA